MKKAVLAVIIALVMIISLIPFSTQAAAWDGTTVQYPSGDGSEASPYKIKSANELAGLAKMVNDGDSLKGKFIVLEADIDLGEKPWTPIGETSLFSGNFDGNGFEVKGLTGESTKSYMGLFGHIKDATIQNLDIQFTSLKSNLYAGALAGHAEVTSSTGKTLIRNVHVNGGTLWGEQCGGLLGRISTAGAEVTQQIVEYCSVTSVSYTTIVAADATPFNQIYSGALIGASGAVTIRYCWTVDCSFAAGGNHSGYLGLGGIIGIQGANSRPAFIQNCYTVNFSATVDPSTKSDPLKINVGGIVGRCGNTNKQDDLQNCFAIGVKFSAPDGCDCFGGIAGLICYMVNYCNCYTDYEKGYGRDNTYMDMPFHVVKTDDVKNANAVEKLKLNLGNSKEVWKYDSYAGYPTFDLTAVNENVFTATSWLDLVEEETTVEETTAAPVVTTAVETKPETTPETKAPETEAPVTEPAAEATEISETKAPETEAPAKKSGCGSAVSLGVALVAVFGSAIVFKKH